MKKIALIPLLLSLPLSVAADNVSKITRSVSIQDGEQRYAQVTVSCTNNEKTVRIRKAQGNVLWCVDGLNNKCSAKKVRAAKLACRSDKLIDTPTVAKDTDTKAGDAELKPAAAEQVGAEIDRFELEAELIDIKQRELDLRRQTLELQKRKLSDSELTSG